MQIEQEIIITRDSKPVARLVRVKQANANRPRWNPQQHRKWVKKVFGDQVFSSGDERLAAARTDRKLN